MWGITPEQRERNKGRFKREVSSLIKHTLFKSMHFQKYYASVSSALCAEHRSGHGAVESVCALGRPVNTPRTRAFQCYIYRAEAACLLMGTRCFPANNDANRGKCCARRQLARPPRRPLPRNLAVGLGIERTLIVKSALIMELCETDFQVMA